MTLHHFLLKLWVCYCCYCYWWRWASRWGTLWTALNCSREGHPVGVGRRQDWGGGMLPVDDGGGGGRAAWRQHSRDSGGENGGETRVETPFRGDAGKFRRADLPQPRPPQLLQHSCNCSCWRSWGVSWRIGSWSRRSIHHHLRLGVSHPRSRNTLQLELKFRKICNLVYLGE